jgi:hypothetical protein
VLTHNMLYISELPPLYAVERGSGGEYLNCKRTDPPSGGELGEAKFKIYLVWIKVSFWVSRKLSGWGAILTRTDGIPSRQIPALFAAKPSSRSSCEHHPES